MEVNGGSQKDIVVGFDQDTRNDEKHVMAGGFRVEIRKQYLSTVKLVPIWLFDDQNIDHILDQPIGTSLYFEDIFTMTGIICLKIPFTK